MSAGKRGDVLSASARSLTLVRISEPPVLSTKSRVTMLTLGPMLIAVRLTPSASNSATSSV